MNKKLMLNILLYCKSTVNVTYCNLEGFIYNLYNSTDETLDLLCDLLVISTRRSTHQCFHLVERK